MKTTFLRAERLAYLGLFTALALVFSYLEHLLPLPLPLPGFKLGLCNLVVMFCAFRLSLWDAALLSFLRVLLTALLFGGVTSFLFSFFGATLAFLSLVFSKKLLYGKLSFIGVSALSAAAFNIGQLLAASLLYHSFAPFSYLAILLVASVVLGSALGLLMNLLANRLTLLPITQKGGIE